jgi:3-isopropylmalate dehydrogenase
MQTYRIGVLRGDGIGPEVVEATVRIMEAAADRVGMRLFEWADLMMGWPAIHAHGHPLPDRTKRELADCHGWIMGPHDSASYPTEFQHMRNPSGELRHHFDLYANIRPAKTYPTIKSVATHADLVIVRENTEGFYPDRNMYAGNGEWMPSPDIAISVGVFTRRASERIAHIACQLAIGRRRQVTIVHKANVIKLGTGLFLDTCREVAQMYPDVAINDYHIDAVTAHLVRRMADFDVIVTTNMFGDILSDLTGELAGSLGMAPSLNHGTDRAMAQAAHGAAPDIAGRELANPMGEIVSAIMLLDWMAAKYDDSRLRDIGRCIDGGITRTLTDGILTRDMGGQATTSMFTQAIIDRL